MIKKLSTWLLRISSTWLMIISLLIMVGFMIFVLPNQAAKGLSESGSDQSPDTSFFYLPQDLYQMAAEYGETGRQAYIHARWSFDLVFPLVYSAFLVLGISWFVQRLSGWKEAWKYANLTPVLAGIFDLLENTATSGAMAAFPARPDWILVSASLFTPVKWTFVSISFLFYFVLAAGWIYQLLRRDKD